MTSKDRQAGIILVLMSAMLVLLVAVGLALTQGAALSAAGARSVLDAAQAHLSAASGMEYAAARLSRGGYPLWGTTPDTRSGRLVYLTQE